MTVMARDFGWELRGEVGLRRSEVDCRRDVTSLVGTGAVDVDNGDFFVCDGFLQVSDADVCEFTGECGGRDEHGGDEHENFLHVVVYFWSCVVLFVNVPADR